jgi:hydrogenase-4 component F
MSDLMWSYLPVAWPAAGAIVAAVAPPQGARTVGRVTALGLGALALWTAADAVRGSGPWDFASLWLLIPAMVLGALGLWASDGYLVREQALAGVAAAAAEGPSPGGTTPPAAERRYIALYAAFAATIALVATASGILLMWAGVEATTLASVFLVAHPRTPTALEASWKYLSATVVGGLIALIGTVVVSLACHVPLTAPPWIEPARLVAAATPEALVGFAFAAIGFGTKVGLAPMHGWLPDAHSEAPAPVSALLSGVELATILYALTRLERIVSVSTGSAWPGDLLIALGLASLLLASLFVSAQSDMKRAYAYSSIEHMGLVAFGAGVGGLAVVGALLHVWTHAFTKSGLFLAAGNVRHRFGASALPQAEAVIRRLPLSGWAIALGTWGIAGLPPFGPFFSEWLILRGAVGRGDVLPALAAVCLVAAVAVGLGRRVPRMLAGARLSGLTPPPRAGGAWERAGEFWPMALLTAFGMVSGIAAPAIFGGLLAHAGRALTGGILP